MSADTSNSTSRRDFLTTAAAGAAAASTLLSLNAHVHANGGEAVRVGLVGCGSRRGGRGRGAAINCVNGGSAVELYALADLFPDHLEYSKKILKDGSGRKYNVSDDRCFVGLDAYQRLLDLKEIDVVVLAAPPGFRPEHLRAAVKAGKHVFAEKPVATDAPGCRAIADACAEAEKNKLSIVSGLCWRYDHGMRELMKRVHGGDIGEILNLQCTYNTSTPWVVARDKAWSDTEWQIRNWPFFTWLSGDFNTEQHIHSLDKMAWLMRNVYPVKAYGLGGRQTRTDAAFGHIFDHMAVVYEWQNGVKCFAYCRQQPDCHNETTDYVIGTQGKATLLGRNQPSSYVITGQRAWRYPLAQLRRDPDMYQVEHNELFASIRNGQPINDGDWMAKSTLLGIMGRMACYTGRSITWDQALNAREDLTPPDGYRMDRAPAVPAVARPGITTLS